MVWEAAIFAVVCPSSCIVTSVGTTTCSFLYINDVNRLFSGRSPSYYVANGNLVLINHLVTILVGAAAALPIFGLPHPKASVSIVLRMPSGWYHRHHCTCMAGMEFNRSAAQ